MCATREVRVRQTTSWFSPVPPAIMPRCLAVLVSAGDFLSACTAKTPAGGTRTSGGIRTLPTSSPAPAGGAHLCPCIPADRWVP